MDYNHYVQRLYNELALHRFNIHPEEVRRTLKPILEEVSFVPDDTVSNDEVDAQSTHEDGEPSACDISSAEPELSADTSVEG